MLVSREDRAVSVLGGARLDAVFWVSDSVLGCVDGGRMVILVSRQYYYLYWGPASSKIQNSTPHTLHDQMMRAGEFGECENLVFTSKAGIIIFSNS